MFRATVEPRLTGLEVAGNRGHCVTVCLCASRGAGLRRIFVSLVTYQSIERYASVKLGLTALVCTID